MFTLFGILTPATGPSTASNEAPFKKSFFGAPVDPGAVAPLAVEEDALYFAGKQPCPPERCRGYPLRHS
jgi:hypothetical protein